MEQRMHAVERNLELLNIAMAVHDDRYDRIIDSQNEMRRDVKILLDRTARVEATFVKDRDNDRDGGNGKLKGIFGGLAAVVMGAAGFLIERR